MKKRLMLFRWWICSYLMMLMLFIEKEDLLWKPSDGGGEMMNFVSNVEFEVLIDYSSGYVLEERSFFMLMSKVQFVLMMTINRTLFL